MMESVHHVSVPLRAGKKMKKRKELDALVAHSAVAGKRSGSCGSGKRSGGSGGGGASSQDGLLSESTDEQDDYWVLGGGKGRGGRAQLLRRRACGSLLRACSVVLVFACVLATTTVMWLFIDIREQVTSLRIELDQVAAGSQGVPDALQKCHSVSRELQQNQTALYARLTQLTQQIGNFSTQLTGLHSGLTDVEERLKAAPELVNVPQHISDLSASVASFGSQIGDLLATVDKLKDKTGRLEDTGGALVLNVTALQASVAQVANISARPAVASQQKADESAEIRNKLAQIAANVSLVNDTLLSKLNWLLDDQHKDHALIEALQNVGQNVTARVTTLEGGCAKESAQAVLVDTIKKLADNVSSSDRRLSEMSAKLSLVQSLVQSQADSLERRAPLEAARTEPSAATPSAPALPPPSTPAPGSPPSAPPAPLVDVKPPPAPKPPVTRP